MKRRQIQAIAYSECAHCLTGRPNHILGGLNLIAAAMPFPILGVDSDNGSEFINDDLLRGCPDR